MTIITHNGDLLSVTDGIIVHGCNCQGKMGSGVALAVRQKWPIVYETYFYEHRRFGLKLGTIIPVPLTINLTVVNALTQEFYGRDGKQYVSYDAMYDCFEAVNNLALDLNKSVHFPLIGCSLGGGDWDIVSQIINDTVAPSISKNLWIKINK